MYERFYELRERPFALSPDPDYLYPSRVHREALDYLRYGLESHAGFIVITGEIGSGKTTLLQTLLRGIDTETTVGRIVNTLLEPRELLETIMIDFGLDPGGRSKPLLLRDLAQYLVDQRLAGRLVLLVIDEAQNLSFAALEELRMLSNLETEKSKLLQIALVGQPNLRDKLASPELEQLRQRITVSYHLMPLDADETANYINHRLRRAAVGAPLEFPRDVTELIHTRSRGVPRIINVICDAALVFGYAEERRQIDLALMHDVMIELEATGVLPAIGSAAPESNMAGNAVSGGIAAGSLPRERPDVAVLADYAPRSKSADGGIVQPRYDSGRPAAAAEAASASPTGSAPNITREPLPSPHTLAPVAALAKTEAAAASTTSPSAALRPQVATTTVADARVGSAGPTSISKTTVAIPLTTRGADGVPTVSVARGAATLDNRAKSLDEREQMVLQRERELAEQRRVLAEEYRLLRAQRSASTAAPIASNDTVRLSVPHPVAPARFDSDRSETAWARMKRVLLGRTDPAMEEN